MNSPWKNKPRYGARSSQRDDATSYRRVFGNVLVPANRVLAELIGRFAGAGRLREPIRAVEQPEFVVTAMSVMAASSA